MEIWSRRYSNPYIQFLAELNLATFKYYYNLGGVMKPKFEHFEMMVDCMKIFSSCMEFAMRMAHNKINP